MSLPPGYVPMSTDPLRDRPDPPPGRFFISWTGPMPKFVALPKWLCVFCGVEIEGPDLSCAAPACVAQVPNDEDGRG